MNNIFGTDGIRALVGSKKMHPEFVMRLGWALGKTLEPNSKVLVGKDTRISGYMFESALEAGLSAAGVHVLLLGPLPTPGIAYLTKTLRAQAGIVISASHNPYYDNGIKLFLANGRKFTVQKEQEIEKWLNQPMELVDSAQLGKVNRINDAVSRYVEFCKSTVKHVSLKGLHIVLDCAHGAAYKTAPLVFSELEATVTLLGDQPNGLNINNGVGSTHPELLSQTVKKLNADIGIAFDGDADRCIMCDATGRLIDGDEIMYLIAKDRLEHNKLSGPVVGTVMTNLGIERALEKLGIELIRAKVGDKYVLEQLLKHKGIIGGEASGHIICLDATSTGDGIVGSLQILRHLAQTNSSLAQSLQGVEKLPLQLINVAVNNPKEVLQAEITTKAQEKFIKRLANKGRILIRASGTEPVIRVMVEGENRTEVNEIAHKMASVIRGFVR